MAGMTKSVSDDSWLTSAPFFADAAAPFFVVHHKD